MDKEILLNKIGLEEKEARVYLAILELGEATIKPIADKAGLKRTTLYYFIDHLVETGLISQFNQNNRTHYKANSPDKLVTLEEERLSLAKSALPELMGLFNLNVHKPRINYYEGPEQIKNIVRQEPLCSTEALYIWPGEDIMETVGGKRFMEQVDNQRIEKGVSIKTIRFRHKDMPFETSVHGLEYLRELRWAPEGVDIKIGIGIYDTGKVSFFSSQQENFGLLIESHELYGAMRLFHQLLWEKSTPAKIGEG